MTRTRRGQAPDYSTEDHRPRAARAPAGILAGCSKGSRCEAAPDGRTRGVLPVRRACGRGRQRSRWALFSNLLGVAEAAASVDVLVVRVELGVEPARRPAGELGHASADRLRAVEPLAR